MKYCFWSQDGAKRWKTRNLYIVAFSSIYWLSFYYKALKIPHIKLWYDHLHHTDCNWLSLCSNTTLLNSKVVTVIVKPTPNLLSTPVEIEFPHLHNVSP